MKKYCPLLFTFILILTISGCSPDEAENKIPLFLIGEFEDDYGIMYSVSDSLFTMEQHTNVHILEWNVEEQYFIGQNDSLNQYDPLLYTRIDWMEFEGMKPFEWGFCMSAYDAVSADSAKAVDTPDRSTPKTGCAGHPFSRMKRINTEG